MILSSSEFEPVERPSRWRPIDPDGTVQPDPAPEPPDEPDEGESGPAEADGLCTEIDCPIQTRHFAHTGDTTDDVQRPQGRAEPLDQAREDLEL